MSAPRPAAGRVIARVKVSELRAAYAKGVKLGVAVNVAALGITYQGQPITALLFERYQKVSYLGTASHGDRVMAAFQDMASIDD